MHTGQTSLTDEGTCVHGARISLNVLLNITFQAASINKLEQAKKKKKNWANPNTEDREYG